MVEYKAKNWEKNRTKSGQIRQNGVKIGRKLGIPVTLTFDLLIYNYSTIRPNMFTKFEISLNSFRFRENARHKTDDGRTEDFNA